MDDVAKATNEWLVSQNLGIYSEVLESSMGYIILLLGIVLCLCWLECSVCHLSQHKVEPTTTPETSRLHVEPTSELTQRQFFQI
jgi:hypothetical protein